MLSVSAGLWLSLFCIDVSCLYFHSKKKISSPSILNTCWAESCQRFWYKKKAKVLSVFAFWLWLHVIVGASPVLMSWLRYMIHSSVPIPKTVCCSLILDQICSRSLMGAGHPSASPDSEIKFYTASLNPSDNSNDRLQKENWVTMSPYRWLSPSFVDLVTVKPCDDPLIIVPAHNNLV